MTLHALPGAPDAAACAEASAFQILASCHEHISERLLTLEQVGIELLDGGALDEPVLARLGLVLTFLDVAIPIHTADEERTLFPRLRACAAFRDHAGGTPMDQMEHEHVDHGAVRLRLNVALVKQDAEAVGRAALRIVRDYREHIHKEDECLFPMARELLTDPATLAEMTEEMRARRREAGLIGC